MSRLGVARRWSWLALPLTFAFAVWAASFLANFEQKRTNLNSNVTLLVRLYRLEQSIGLLETATVGIGQPGESGDGRPRWPELLAEYRQRYDAVVRSGTLRGELYDVLGGTNDAVDRIDRLHASLSASPADLTERARQLAVLRREASRARDGIAVAIGATRERLAGLSDLLALTWWNQTALALISTVLAVGVAILANLHARDLGRRKQVEVVLKASKEAAEQASRAKDQFLAVLSHELRTPLTPVLAVATSMLDQPDTAPELRRTLEMIRRNVELEARLIDDLLDVSRIGRGKLRIDLKPVDVHELIDQALEICDGQVRAAGLSVTLDLAATASHVMADPTRLQQVFWNLLMNAVKFTPSGGQITVRTRNDAEGRLVAEVSDTGIGIEPEVLPKIFDAFEQGRPALRRRSGGLGLGLAIGRSVIEAHDGRLTAASAGKDRGASFTLELATISAPIAAGPPRPELSDREVASHGPLKLLLVEDNRDTLRCLALVLRHRGHEVHTAENVASAQALAATEALDLLISDIELPDGTGLDLMRDLGGGHDLPGIAMSGFGSDEDIQLSRDAGFAEHLTKPVDFRRLEATMNRVLADCVDRAASAS